MGDNVSSGREGQQAESLVTEAELNAAIQRATRKLDWIIQREGDADGERRKAYYFQQLIKEALNEERLRRSFNGEMKKRLPAKPQGNPSKTSLIIA